jgi:4-hydroxy-tetrahydrodipicolinate synthase
MVAMDEAAGRVPVYAGTSGITTREAVMLTGIAEECKVDAVSVLTPMFLTPGQEELISHYKTIAANTSLPVILYNNPPKTMVSLNPSTVAKLAEIKNIAGIKDSSGDMTVAAEYIRLTRHLDDFSVMMGRDTLIYGALCYGASGSIASCANVAPGICADIYEKFMAGDLKGSLEAQFTLAPLRLAFSLGTFPAVIKESLILLGIDAGPCMEPAGPLTNEERAKLRKVLVDMGLLK